MSLKSEAIAQLGQKIVQRFSTPPHISRVLWKAQPEDRDAPFMRSLRLLAMTMRVPLPKFGKDDADTIPWYGIRAEHVTNLRTHLTRTLPKPKSQGVMQVLIEGMELVHKYGHIKDEEMDAIYKAAGRQTTVETRKAEREALAAKTEAKRV